MSEKINYVVKTPSVKGGIFTVFKVVESNGKIESKELFFTGSKDRIIEIITTLLNQQLKIQGSITGQFIHVKSELLQEIPECFDEKTGNQAFLCFDGEQLI